MIRSPSASTSTRVPSRRPARSAISLGMRKPRLLPQRATCTCIGLSIRHLGYTWDIQPSQSTYPADAALLHVAEGRDLASGLGRDGFGDATDPAEMRGSLSGLATSGE